MSGVLPGLLRAGLLMGLLGCATPSGADDAELEGGLPPVQAIRIEGNAHTRAEIILQEMSIKVGDPADPMLMEQSRQAVMDLGLFKSVVVRLDASETGTILVLVVKEKYYILPIPKLNRDDDNNFSYGGQLRLDNLAGLNQQLRFTYETDDAETITGGTIDSYSTEYLYPRLLGTAWQLGGSIEVAKSQSEVATGGVVEALADAVGWNAGLIASRWLRRDAPSRGWRAGGGLVWHAARFAPLFYDPVKGVPDSFSDGRGVGIVVDVAYLNVRNFLYSRTGKNYGYSGEFGSPGLGSDNNYTRHTFYYRRHFPLPPKAHRNLDVQFRLGLSSDRLLGADAYAVGGAKTLRGYDTGYRAGKAYALINAEYLTPWERRPEIRGVLFVDVGNAYPNNHSINLSGLAWSAGVGVRWKLKSFVRLDLRVDAAYAFETGESKIIAGSRETF